MISYKTKALRSTIWSYQHINGSCNDSVNWWATAWLREEKHREEELVVNQYRGIISDDPPEILFMKFHNLMCQIYGRPTSQLVEEKFLKDVKAMIRFHCWKQGITDRLSVDNRGNYLPFKSKTLFERIKGYGQVQYKC